MMDYENPRGTCGAPSGEPYPGMPDYENTVLECSLKLSGSSSDPGAARSIRAPQLNILLGEGAERRQAVLMRTCQEVWAGNANQLGWLCTNDMSPGSYPGALYDKAAELLSKRQVFADCWSLRLNWYWDLMDDRFDALFAQVKQPRQFSNGISVQEAYFLFGRIFRENDRDKFRSRLEQVEAWAREEGQHLLIQSDVTDGGLLSEDAPEDEDSMTNSYRIAAQLSVLMNSVMRDNNEQAGQELEFTFQNSSVCWTVGSTQFRKKNREIARAVLRQLLEENLHQQERVFGTMQVKETLCGGKDYPVLFDRYLEEQGLLPQKQSVLDALPCTPEMLAFERSLLEEPKRGLRLFRAASPDKVDEGKRLSAISSLGDLWDLCLETCYGDGLKRLQSQPAAVKDWFKQQMCMHFSSAQMTQLLPGEAETLRKRNDWKAIPDDRRGTLAECLHRAAWSAQLPKIYEKMAALLAEAMDELCKDARSFDKLLKQAYSALERDSGETTIVKAYGNRVARLAAEAPALVQLVPCQDMNALLEQLKTRFAQMVEKVPELKLPLFDELDFRADMSGQRGDRDAVQDLFRQQNLNNRRMRLFEPPSPMRTCCLLHQTDRIRDLPHMGKPFRIPRQDYVEQLCLYPMDISNIMY